MCAALTWRGLVANANDLVAGRHEGRERLLAFWRDLSARSVFDVFLNRVNVSLARSPVLLDVSPYLYEPSAEPILRQLLRTHLALDRLDASDEARGRPKLLIGATDVLEGERLIFEGEHLTEDELMASAAVPFLFRSVRAGDRLCWDGLFTTNPPLREFTDPDLRVPDEIWIVQINPQRLAEEPRTHWAITDRRNELAGNLSLGQELFFIQKINELVAKHEVLAGRYKHIEVRVVELDAGDLDYASKLDRDGALIERLIALGQERAAWFFDDRSLWPHRGAVPATAVRAGDGAR